VKLERLITFFSSNPSAKLLRAQHAPYVIDFLYLHFKKEGHLTSLHSVLQQHLSSYLENLHETEPEILRDRADAYLNAWSTGESRWLRRFFDSQHAESVYQLTPHTEDVLTFLTGVLEINLGFIGTESRLSRIVGTLSDLVVRGSDDPERRMTYLRAEKARIEAEMRSIEAGNVVETHSPTAIRERFADAVSDLVSLQGDFRAVEESFKTITRSVQQRQADSFSSRGDILGFALEAEDELKDQDQGASFQAFVKLILSQSQQDALERLIAQLDDIVELAEQLDGKQRVKGMISGLSAEAEKILSVTRRLNATLRRLLDTRSTSSRMRVAELLGEIRMLAARHAQNPPAIGMNVLSDLDLLNVHQRTFWEAPVRFEELQLANTEQSEDDRLLAFKHLAEMQRLEWDIMRSNISHATLEADQVSLRQLLDQYPASGGPLEVLGYIQLAHEDGHLVDSGSIEVIHLRVEDDAEAKQAFEVPKVVFLSHRLRLFSQSLAIGGVGDE
jgi:hypothetical protein